VANSIFGVGITGLNASQAGLLTSGHNISNVNTRGYNRQEIVQSANLPQFSGSGFIGQGVNITTVRRAYDALLQGQTWQVQSSVGHFERLAAQVGRIDSVLANPDVGMSPALGAFFGAVHDLAANPSDAASRQGMLAQARSLVARIGQLNDQFDTQRSDLNGRLPSVVDQASSLSAQIASLNHRILSLKSGGNEQQMPNDLLDQRDQLVSDLSTLVRVQVVSQDDGSYNVYLSSGQPLVVKEGANRLKAVPAADDPGRMEIALQRTGGLLNLRASDFTGGQLGGLLEFRDSVLDPAQNALGRIAMTLTAAFNDQHRLGQDLYGHAGGSFFASGAPRVLASMTNAGSATFGATVASPDALSTSDYRLVYDGTGFGLTRLSDGQVTALSSLPQTVDGVTLALTGGTPAAGDSFLIQPTRAGAAEMDLLVNDARRIAAGAPIRTAAAIANAGTGTISAGSVNSPAPPDPNLLQPVTITFTSPSTFDVSGTGTGNPSGVSFSAGDAITYNGWTVRLGGVPAAGDTFTISVNSGGAGDNRNALALAGLQSRALVAGSSANLQGAYAQLVSDVGNRAQEAEISRAAQAGMLASIEQARQSASAVNLDEEAANLLRYQQAYQAAGKVIAIAGSLFDTVLRLGD